MQLSGKVGNFVSQTSSGKGFGSRSWIDAAVSSMTSGFHAKMCRNMTTCITVGLPPVDNRTGGACDRDTDSADPPSPPPALSETSGIMEAEALA